MPRRNSLKDSIKIYYAYRLGLDEDNQGVFGDILSTTAYYSDRNGLGSESHFGTENSYGITLILNESDATRYFDNYTKVWIYTTPKSSTDQPDYRIKGEPISRDGQIMVSLESVAINHKEFYYLKGDKIITFAATWDAEKSKFYTPTNMYLPIDKRTKMWYIEPDDENAEDGLITLVRKTSRGRYMEYTYGENQTN